MPVAHEVLRRATGPDAGRAALRCAHRTRTWAELAADVAAGAAHLRGVGVVAGDLVALTLTDPVDTLVAMLAVDHAGGVALVGDPAWGVHQRAEVLRALAPAAVVAVPLPRGRRVPADPGPPPADDVAAWAGFSSGSTGRPRAVRRTRGSWTRSFGHVSALTGTTPADTVLVTGPLAGSLHCFAAVHALGTGAGVLVAPTPTAAVAALPDVDVAHVVPSRLDDLLDALDQGAPSRLRTVVVGGAALDRAQHERAAAHGLRLVAYYGAVELSFVAVDTGDGLRPFPEVEVDVRPAPHTGLGEVWVRSPWTADGYLAGARGPLQRSGDWCTVGDLADLAGPDAPLVLRGRGDGAILTAGATVVPEDVELALRPVPGVRDVVVVGAPHRRLGAVVVAVVEADARPGLRAHLDRVARSTLAPAQRPRRWYRLDALPRTGGGKPARSALGAAVAGIDPTADVGDLEALR
ncbi:acyl-CoA synthetase (AMP-forming)/AMP-acid ligase II [Isoptericola jiangsuensis]|uniref:Acyl-CoA synthetase (AMP-forming)/AMP-acid ligase II n=1 Tax=Isoptericola jiangsuensis TaxID=548579 RepID=A0A2A9EWF7_9MICO|nr:AMP-binding protein [Isoptericola jiangsuensis]PFG42632.1 acyl-CoA synthetase (AMP-forming)/AMP-acid ligase II [Isoptericola jiangsuensis]